MNTKPLHRLDDVLEAEYAYERRMQKDGAFFAQFGGRPAEEVELIRLSKLAANACLMMV